MDKREVRKIMFYIINGDGHTLTETAEHFNISRFDIRKMVDRLNDKKDELYDEVLASEVNDKLSKALKHAKSKAGQKSRKKKVISKEEALALRFRNLYAGKSLRTLAKEKGCSFMSISNAIKNLPAESKKAQDETAKKITVKAK